VSAGKEPLAEFVLQKLVQELSALPISEFQALLFSRMARLYVRLGFQDRADSYYKQAVAMQFHGSRADLTSAAITIDQIHSLMFESASDTVELVANPLIREPIESLISSVRLSQLLWSGG
jgi:hypothetical protein